MGFNNYNFKWWVWEYLANIKPIYPSVEIEMMYNCLNFDSHDRDKMRDWHHDGDFLNFLQNSVKEKSDIKFLNKI